MFFEPSSRTIGWLRVNQRILNVFVVKDLNSIIFTIFTLVDFVHYTTMFSYPLASGRHWQGTGQRKERKWGICFVHSLPEGGPCMLDEHQKSLFQIKQW